MELIFEICDAEEGGVFARALGQANFTEAETWEQLRASVLDAVALHFEDAPTRPRLVQMHSAKTPGSCTKLPRSVSADRLIRALEHLG